MATVNYIPCKKQCPASLTGLSNYVRREDKTNSHFISGQNCSPQFSQLEFLATRDQFRKTSPQYFYHYTQSFHPNEPVTGELAHTIAKKFAAKAWPNSEVLIATHIDADHIHSHFVVNAVCCNGKVLHFGPDNIHRLRNISDRLCEAHQLSVLENPKKHSDGMSSREYRSAVKGESWKLQMMNTIDQCMRVSGSKEDFRKAMRERGYDMIWTGERKHITYITPGGMKCRSNKLHNPKYTKEMMELEFRIRADALYGRALAQERAAPDAAAATADHADDLRRAVEAAPLCPVRDQRQDRTSDEHTAYEVPTQRFADDRTDSADETAERIPEETGADTTGWETEREAFFASSVPSFTPGVANSMSVGNDLGRGDLTSALVQVGRRLEQLQSAETVSDSTTTRHRIDSKELRRIKELKIARGQAEDDHEEDENYKYVTQQTM